MDKGSSEIVSQSVLNTSKKDGWIGGEVADDESSDDWPAGSESHWSRGTSVSGDSIGGSS